ncbi:hypothetical protein IMCC1989_2469 [gamma proteobacterium IMCC1989]|nr:hypothetical protein IMCC1989_2469 [gamma proteobacterium IMCC1989]
MKTLFSYVARTRLVTASVTVIPLCLSLITFPAAAAEGDSQWMRCASEWGMCTPPMPTHVRYGVELEGQAYYVSQYTDGPIKCTNNTFGNPLNVVKHCDYLLSTTVDYDGDGVVDSLDAFPNDITETHDSDGDGFGDNNDPFPSDPHNNREGNWLFCANEWGICVPPVPALVRYGLDQNGTGSYTYQYVSSEIGCRNSIFGNPINVVKRCDYILSATADYDGDGVADSLDAFPNDIAEAYDSDGDGFGDNSDPFPLDGRNNASGDWVHCADEWYTCTLPAPALVRYGANGVYVFTNATDSIRCTNSALGNPINIVKSCDYLLSTSNDADGDGVVDSEDAFPSDIAEAYDSDGDGFGDNSDPFPNDAQNNSAAAWVFCANEWGTCQVPASSLVRYGVESHGQGYFAYQSVDNTIACRNSVFGNPINVVKRCEYLLIDDVPVVIDTDGDGIADTDDAFPNDPLQSQDSNGGGIGDNIATSQAVSYTYNDHGQILTINGPRTDVDDITTYTYDSNGNRTHITNALGHQTILSEHNGRGQPQQITSVNGTQTNLTYHVRGWLLSVTVIHPTATGFDSTTAYEYDNTGNITKIIRPDNVELIYHYDTSNRLVAVSNNAGERIDYVLDNAGNRLSQTIQDGSATITYRLQQAYDELSRVMEIVGADDQTTQIDYDVNSNPVETINPRNFASQNTYDPLNRLTQTTDADNGTTQFSYDKQDRLTSVTDANGNITSYEYDAFDNLIEQNSPDTGISRHVYDNAGNRLISVDSRGIVTRYTYDVLNRLTHAEYPTSPEENVTYTYDVDEYTHSNGDTYHVQAIGRLFRIEDQSGVQFYGYDHRGNVVSHVRAIGHDASDTNQPTYSTDYVYDISNNLIEIQSFIGGVVGVADPLSYYVTYRYDSVGRVNEVLYGTENGPAPPSSLVDNIIYLPFGPVAQIDYSNGSSTQMAYDQDYRLVEQQTQTDNSTLIDRSYSYDPNGNIVRIDNLAQDPYNQQFEYDPIDRLASITKDLDSGESDSRIRAYGYDLVGNRLTSTFSQGDMGYSDDYGYLLGNNILADILRTGAAPQSTTYTFDDIGNTTAMNKASGNIQFTYNAANRPIKVLSNGIETHYGYNALGQRTSKTQQGETTHYIYTLQGQLMGEYRSDGQPIVEYIYWNNQPLAQIRNKVAYYYHNDHLGTPTALTNAAQETVWQAEYEAFGEATLTEESVENNLRFAGQYFDEETNFHYNYFRTYDPSTGRYLQSDPIGLQGGINTYAYVENNPLMYVDPLGLWSLKGRFYSGGRGFGVTLGESNGKSFIVVDVGIGKGGGFSYDPDGDFPRPEGTSPTCEPEAWIGFSASAGGNAGPFNFGGTGYSGMYAGEGNPQHHEGVSPYATGSNGRGVGLSASGGVRVGVSW